MLPSVAQYCDVRIGATEKHHGVADAVEGQCMTKARYGTKVLYLRPVLAIETPAIAASDGVTAPATPEQHNRARRCCDSRANATGRSESRYLNPARAVPRPSPNGGTIEQEHPGACAVKGHYWLVILRSGVFLLGPLLAVELLGIQKLLGRRRAPK